MFESEILKTVINTISTLPGLGKRSATRIALHLISKNQEVCKNLGILLQEISQRVTKCEMCNNIDESSPCWICRSQDRNCSVLCVVDSIEAAWNIEQSGHYKGLYYILGSHVSQRSIVTDDMECKALISRVRDDKIKEVILANSPTVFGQTNVFFLAELMQKEINNDLPIAEQIKITRLGVGLPLGSDVDYLDCGTLLAAFNGRKDVEC